MPQSHLRSLLVGTVVRSPVNMVLSNSEVWEMHASPLICPTLDSFPRYPGETEYPMRIFMNGAEKTKQTRSSFKQNQSVKISFLPQKGKALSVGLFK